MNKPLVLTAAALVVSIGVNAWLLSEWAGGDQPAKRDEGLSASKGADRRGSDSGSSGGAGTNAGQPDGVGEAPTARQAPGTLSEILAMGDPFHGTISVDSAPLEYVLQAMQVDAAGLP